MPSKRFYILRICVPDYYFPFLTSIRNQFILESLCDKGFISVYIVADKYKLEKPTLYYNYTSAHRRCKNDNSKRNITGALGKYRMPQKIKILKNQKKKITSESSEEKHIDYSNLCNLNLEDFSIKTESYDPKDENPIVPHLEESLLDDILQCTFEHRKEIVKDIELQIIKNHVNGIEYSKSKASPT